MCVCVCVCAGDIIMRKGGKSPQRKKKCTDPGMRLSTSQHAAAQASVLAGPSMTPTAPLQMMGGILYMSPACIKSGRGPLR